MASATLFHISLPSRSPLCARTSAVFRAEPLAVVPYRAAQKRANISTASDFVAIHIRQPHFSPGRRNVRGRAPLRQPACSISLSSAHESRTFHDSECGLGPLGDIAIWPRTVRRKMNCETKNLRCHRNAYDVLVKHGAYLTKEKVNSEIVLHGCGHHCCDELGHGIQC